MPSDVPMKTRDVEALLNLAVGKVSHMIRARRFEPPRKDSSGDFVWTKEDIERLRRALAAPARARRRPQPVAG